MASHVGERIPEAATLAQVRTLRQGGMVVADIADHLGLTIGYVQRVLANEPRRHLRGPEIPPGPGYRRTRGS